MCFLFLFFSPHSLQVAHPDWKMFFDPKSELTAEMYDSTQTSHTFKPKVYTLEKVFFNFFLTTKLGFTYKIQFSMAIDDDDSQNHPRVLRYMFKMMNYVNYIFVRVKTYLKPQQHFSSKSIAQFATVVCTFFVLTGNGQIPLFLGLYSAEEMS